MSNIFIQKTIRLFPYHYFTRQIEKTKKNYRRERLKNPKSNFDEWIQRERNDIEQLYKDWEYLKSEKLLRIAGKYDLLIPIKYIEGKLTRYWNISYDGSFYLTLVGRHSVKKRILSERRRKKDSITYYSNIFIGFLGLLIGLLSVILN